MTVVKQGERSVRVGESWEAWIRVSVVCFTVSIFDVKVPLAYKWNDGQIR